MFLVVIPLATEPVLTEPVLTEPVLTDLVPTELVLLKVPALTRGLRRLKLTGSIVSVFKALWFLLVLGRFCLALSRSVKLDWLV